MHRQQSLQLEAAVLAFSEMLFQRGHLFIGQLAVCNQDDVLLR
jgi:hypothetical protein